MKKELIALGILFVLIAVMLISGASLQGNEGRVIEEVVGDIWDKESPEDYVITGYFEEGENISISAWAPKDWFDEQRFDPGDDYHDYRHIDVFICIIDDEGKNITLDIPFVPSGATCWMRPDGIFAKFSNAVHWYNWTDHGLITRSGKYTIRYLGCFPIQSKPIFRLRVTKTRLEGKNSMLLLAGISTFLLGLGICLVGLRKEKKKKKAISKKIRSSRKSTYRYVYSKR